MVVIIYDIEGKFICFYPASVENLLSESEKPYNSHLHVAMETGTI